MTMTLQTPAAYLEALNDAQLDQLTADFGEHMADELAGLCMDHPLRAAQASDSPAELARDAAVGRRVRVAFARFVERRAERSGL